MRIIFTILLALIVAIGLIKFIEHWTTKELARAYYAYEEAEASFNLALEQREYERQEEAHRIARENALEPVRIALKGRPLAPYAEAFYEASVVHLNGDWEMLVSLHISEQGSGCADTINCFGNSASGYARMGTRENEIWAVAKMLSTGGYAGLTPEQKLCRWNTGRATTTCEYSGLALYKKT